ncbi:TPA: hypothetical protein ACJIKU_000540 [Citrobacter freundii]|uniref:Uncharacterized protein n=1 Tax=Citrobacter freundii TaxID=546 RepID=A0AAP9QCH5_CITFR|nr:MULTISPECIES: hypothetical protein [Citrobacter freundii complex]EKV4145528.1 hypothetical protein [Citrobacter freundii]ELK6654407.1 hypothetical protein [Citrobacter freundii]ELO3997314.1 hypothetical protein [Citrobacter freundii]ELT0526374.1 hypothetical protein [Citrobacter freundii]MBJ9307027.1 hypothetical protein [Citrobacter freundii]
MKSYLIENYANLQGLIGISFMFLMLAIIFISYVINGYNYKIIAKAYENKFGLLPQTARLARGASLIGTPAAYFAKIDFIMGSLIFPYNRVINHDMSIESYNYIRNLPGHLTTGFKIEAALWLAELILAMAFMLIEFIV